jgi:hypothetical protein
MAAGVSTSDELSAVFVHNGNNNTIRGNIIDLGSSSYESAVVYGYDSASLVGMAANVIEGNIIISNFTGGLNSLSGKVMFYQNNPAPVSDFTISHDLYWNYAPGGSVFYNGVNGTRAGDTNPVTGINPEITGSTYSIAQGSPVFNALNFPAIVGGWGPPGFIIPSDLPSSV